MTVVILGEMWDREECGQVQKDIWMGELDGWSVLLAMGKVRGTHQERRLVFLLGSKVRVLLFTT